MPLIPKASKKALQKNIETEMHAHPKASDRARNLAIAYAVKRRAKKMAKGGLLSAKEESRPMPGEEHMAMSPIDQDARKERMSDLAQDRLSMQDRDVSEDPTDQDARMERMSTVDEDQDRLSDDEMHTGSIADEVRREMKMYAEGGQVDLSRNADEDANFEDQQSFDALKKENYSESEGLDALDSPMDSNEHEPMHDEMDEHDKSMVELIRRKMKMLRS